MFSLHFQTNFHPHPHPHPHTHTHTHTHTYTQVPSPFLLPHQAASPELQQVSYPDPSLRRAASFVGRLGHPFRRKCKGRGALRESNGKEGGRKKRRSRMTISFFSPPLFGLYLLLVWFFFSFMCVLLFLGVVRPFSCSRVLFFFCVSVPCTHDAGLVIFFSPCLVNMKSVVCFLLSPDLHDAPVLCLLYPLCLRWCPVQPPVHLILCRLVLSVDVMSHLL